MVIRKYLRMCGVKTVIRSVQGIWLHRKQFKFKIYFIKDILHFTRAQHDMSYHVIIAPCIFGFIWIIRRFYILGVYGTVFLSWRRFRGPGVSQLRNTVPWTRGIPAQEYGSVDPGYPSSGIWFRGPGVSQLRNTVPWTRGIPAQEYDSVDPHNNRWTIPLKFSFPGWHQTIRLLWLQMVHDSDWLLIEGRFTQEHNVGRQERKYIYKFSISSWGI